MNESGKEKLKMRRLKCRRAETSITTCAAGRVVLVMGIFATAEIAFKAIANKVETAFCSIRQRGCRGMAFKIVAKMLLLLMAVCASSSYGYEAERVANVNGVSWYYQRQIIDRSYEGGAVTTNFVITGAAPIPAGVLEIPSVLNGDIIGGIDEYAFYACTGVTKVIIPEGIENIGWYAFCGCTGIADVSMPSTLRTIGDYAFYDCSQLAKFCIPDGVQNVEEGALLGCSSLREISIPASVTRFDAFSFDTCDGIPSQYLDARKKLERIENIIVSQASTNYMAHDCALYCVGISGDGSKYHYIVFCPPNKTSLDVVEGTTGGDEHAFWGCDKLESMSLPSTMQDVDGIDACAALNEITVAEDNERFFVQDGCLYEKWQYEEYSQETQSYTYSTRVEFCFCPRNKTSVNIATGTDYVSEGAFANCGVLSRIVLPGSLRLYDGDGYGFSSCTNLQSIMLGDESPYLAVIGGALYMKPDGTYSMASSMICCPAKITTLRIPDGVYFESGAFADGALLEEVYIESTTNVLDDCLSGADVGNPFYGCSKLKNIVFENGNTHYDFIDGMLYAHRTFFSGYIQETLLCGTSVAGTEVDIRDGTEVVGAGAFYKNRDLTAVALPYGLERIGAGAFAGCSSLKSITIPPTVTEFEGCDSESRLAGVGIFSGCESLQRIVFEGRPPDEGWVGVPNANCEIVFTSCYREWVEWLNEFSYEHDMALCDWDYQTRRGTICGMTIRYEPQSSATYGPWGESEDVANPDKLWPTYLQDMTLTINGAAGAQGDVVAVYRTDTDAVCGLGKVLDDSGTLTTVCYAPTGTKLHFKVWIAASGVTEPTILDCDAKCDLDAPTSGSFYEGHALVVSDDKELTLSLKKADWYTVSFNVVPDDPSPAAVFADVADKVAAVTQGVNYWMPGKAGTLKQIEVGKGYWVKTTDEGVSWTVSGKTNPSVEIPLTAGWNLIGYAPEDEEAVSSVLKTALAEKAIDYVTYGISFYPNGTLTKMSPGKAYWVHAKKAYTLVYDEVECSKSYVQSLKMAAATVDAIVSIASNKDGSSSSDAFETNASTRALTASLETPTYGPFGESEDVANPDKLGPTMFTDVVLTIDGEPAAVGDCVAVYRGDTGTLCGLGKVLDAPGMLTIVCYAPKGVALNFKAWTAASGVCDPTIVACGKTTAPTAGEIVNGKMTLVASTSGAWSGNAVPVKISKAWKSVATTLIDDLEYDYGDGVYYYSFVLKRGEGCRLVVTDNYEDCGPYIADVGLINDVDAPEINNEYWIISPDDWDGYSASEATYYVRIVGDVGQNCTFSYRLFNGFAWTELECMDGEIGEEEATGSATLPLEKNMTVAEGLKNYYAPYGSRWAKYSSFAYWTPKRTGYAFGGWYTEPKGGIKITEKTKVDGDATWYAHWTYNGLTYVGVIVSDECEGMGTVSGGNKSFKSGAKVSLKATAKKGYVFAGWYLDDAIETIASTCVSQSPSYTYVATGEEDVTIYARFIAVEDDWVTIECAAEEEYAKGETMTPIEIAVDSGSLATVKVTGLPTGMKFTAKALSVKATKTTDAAEYAANTIYGKPTKSGVYTATVTATTAGKAKATKTLKFIVRGEGECIVDADVVLVDAIGTIASTEDVPGKVTGMGVYAMNKKVTLKATANKGYVFMGWYEDGDLVSRLASHVLTMPDYDVSLEARFITAETDRAAIAASVGDEFWFDSDSATAEKTISAGVYLEWPVTAEALSATTIKVTGLPTGLKFTAKDITQKIGTGKTVETVVVVPANTIYGTPSAASKTDKNGNVVPSAVKITVTTAGKNSQTFQIDTTVVALPEQVVGTFTGGSCDDPSGSATLTVAASGKVSGKWISDGKTWTLAASGFTSGEPDGYQFDTTLTAKCGKETEEIPLTVTSDGVALCDLFSAYWSNWKIEPWKTLGKTMANKKYTFYIDADGNTSEDAIDSPYGTVTLTMSANGTVKTAGSFVTGTNAKTGKDIVYKASGSTVLTPIDETTYRVFVYFPPKGAFEGYAKELRFVWDGEGLVCTTISSGVTAKISKHTIDGWEEWYWTTTVSVKRDQAHTFWIKNLTATADISGMDVYYTYKYKEDGETYEDLYYASESCENDDGTEKYVLLTAEDWADIPGTGNVAFTVRVDGWEPETVVDATFTFGHTTGSDFYPWESEELEE